MLAALVGYKSSCSARDVVSVFLPPLLRSRLSHLRSLACGLTGLGIDLEGGPAAQSSLFLFLLISFSSDAFCAICDYSLPPVPLPGLLPFDFNLPLQVPFLHLGRPPHESVL